MLADGDAVESSSDEALEAMDGAVLVQMSTIGPGRDAREPGASGPRPPASRSSTRRCSAPRQPAEQGKLLVLASGPEDVRERVEPVFDAVGAKTLWLGEAGAGSASSSWSTPGCWP